MEYRKIIGCIVLFVLLSGFVSSCSDFFEVEPYEAVVEDDFYKSQKDLNASALGMYAPLSKDVHKFLLWGDARADMVTTGQKEPAPYVNEFVINNVSVQNPYADYGSIYETIARCNRQLERVYDVVGKDDKLLPKSANAYYAEALLLRAICYYYLLRTFESFPIIRSDYAEEISYVDQEGKTVNRKTSELSASEIEDLLQFPEDKQEVWRMIYNDAIAVLGLLPLNFQWNNETLPAEERYGRVSQPTAATFAAELAIWLGEFQTASAFCNSPIVNNQHSLGTAGAWPNQFTGSYAAQHSMFLLGYRFDNSFETNRLQEFTSNIAAEGGKYYLKPASQTINTIFSYESSDVRTNFSFKVFGQDTVIWKYIGLDNVSSRRPAYRSIASWQIYRSADAWLLKALADLHLNDFASAFNFVNMVREARGLVKYLPTDIDYTDKNLMLQVIFTERAREFAFEGKRWYDLMLWSKLSGRNMLAEKVAAKYEGTLRNEVFQKLQDEKNWYLPVN